ncbi:tellurium resistance protein [Streptomyces sp. NPDC046759]|uniref:tellurium resistance protein n=1 Tax=Streptomyces sp. NPDC046759 TaxID=3155019 RepID=UPI0033DB7587
MSNDNRRRGTIRLKPGTAPGTAPDTAPLPDLRPDARPRRVPPGDAVLTRQAPRARVTGRGILQVNLNWPESAGADLDLGCMVSCTDGRGVAVQPLGRAFGSLGQWPYVELDQDDRTGASSDGETVRVNLGRREHFRRLLFYVYVYDGAVDFRSLGAVATVTAPSGGFRIALDDSPGGVNGCAIALAVPEAGALTVRREVRWFAGTPHQSVNEVMDRAYGFGFPWVWMTKD